MQKEEQKPKLLNDNIYQLPQLDFFYNLTLIVIYNN